MIYDRLTSPWECVCNRTLYSQVDDLCMEKAKIQELTQKYSESNAINIVFKDELEVIGLFMTS